jgi:hypothetical protein
LRAPADRIVRLHLSGLFFAEQEMIKIIIRDGTGTDEGNFLSFDLREVLAALGPRAGASSWSFRDLEFVCRDGQEVSELKQDSRATSRLSGQVLISAADRILQVIDGEFAAFDDEDDRPWVIVRAVDSTFWEVESQDADLLTEVSSCFHSVEQEL